MKGIPESFYSLLEIFKLKLASDLPDRIVGTVEESFYSLLEIFKLIEGRVEFDYYDWLYVIFLFSSRDF